MFTIQPKIKVAKNISSAYFPLHDFDDKVLSIFKDSNKPLHIFQVWHKLSDNSLVWPLYHYSCDALVIQYVVPKAQASLDDLIKARKVTVDEIYTITQ